MPRRERFDDGSTIEDLVVEIDSKEYRETFTIKRVDRSKSAFEVDYGLRYHHDTSLFSHSAEDHMRLHACFVLKRMVEDELKGEESTARNRSTSA